MKENKLPMLSPVNFMVMEIVWDLGEASINEVWEVLGAEKGKKVKRTTVQIMLSRLERYGWLTHRKQGKSFYYRPLQGREQTLQDIVNDVRQRIFKGSNHSLIKYLFQNKPVSKNELDEISGLLQELPTDKSKHFEL